MRMREGDRERFIYNIPCQYPRCGAAYPGTFLSVLMIGASAHISGQKLLTFRVIYQFLTNMMVNDLKVRQNRPQGSNFAFKVRLRADDQLPNELVFEYT